MEWPLSMDDFKPWLEAVAVALAGHQHVAKKTMNDLSSLFFVGLCRIKASVLKGEKKGSNY